MTNKKKKKDADVGGVQRVQRDEGGGKAGSPGLWQSIAGRETPSPGSRLFLKGAKHAWDRSCSPTPLFLQLGDRGPEVGRDLPKVP